MDLKNVLHMKQDDENCSYALHGRTTQKLIVATQPVLKAAVETLVSEETLQWPLRVFIAADLGCGTGQNTLHVLSTVKETLRRKCLELRYELPDVQFYLNDLPGNDFNSLFRDIPRYDRDNLDGDDDDDGLIRCFVMGAPGSFHGRLFPCNSLHLVHSNFGVHWLSKAPPELMTDKGFPVNKGKIYISTTSPMIVSQAYLDQFHEDFTMFLRSRSTEMLPNGRIVLILHGRLRADPTLETETSVGSYIVWEQLAEAISQLVSEGLIEEEKLDSFNVPYYIATADEVRAIVEEEGSFQVQFIETLVQETDDKNEALKIRAEKRYKNIRAFTEPLLSHHFGEKIMDQLYDKVHVLVTEDFTKYGTRKTVAVVLTLGRKAY
ncbi:7-methylxanthine methyltransferase 1-like protein [Drosera capensis]